MSIHDRTMTPHRASAGLALRVVPQRAAGCHTPLDWTTSQALGGA